MKKFTYIFFFLSVMISCSESDSNSNERVDDFTFRRTIDLNIPRSTLETPFIINDSQQIPILQFNDVKSVSIDSLSYKLGIYQIPGMTDIKTAEIYINNLLVGTFSDLSVNEQYGSVFPVRDKSLLADIEATLLNDTIFNIDFIGTTTSPWNVGSVRLDFHMDMKITREY